MFTKIIIFFKSSSLCFIFFSARAYALAGKWWGKGVPPFGITHFINSTPVIKEFKSLVVIPFSFYKNKYNYKQ